MSNFFKSVAYGTLGFQIQKIRICIECIESFLRVGSMDLNFFLCKPKGTQNPFFGFEIQIWILTKGTHPYLILYLFPLLESLISMLYLI